MALDFELIKKKLEEIDIDKSEIADFLKYNPLLLSKEHDKQPYYQLWHILYSIEQPEEAVNALIKNFNFTKLFS